VTSLEADSFLHRCIRRQSPGAPSIGKDAAAAYFWVRLHQQEKGGRMGDFVVLVLAMALIFFPFWKIFRRVGLNPAFSLFAFIPYLGWMIAGAILAFSKWPAIDDVARTADTSDV
jgi:hypothetical protein